MESILKIISLAAGLFLAVCAIFYQAVKSGEEIGDISKKKPCEDDK